MDAEVIRRISHDLTELESARARELRYERREVDAVLGGLGGEGRALLLDGPRRTGKSTILLQVLARLRAARPEHAVAYLDLEDSRLGRVSLRDVADALAEAAGHEEEPILLLDEVHNADGWARDLKFLVDHSRARFVVADSCAAIVRSGLRDKGVGRWHRIPVHPLSLSEWWSLRSREGIPPPTSPGERAEGCLQYLHVGGFPAHATTDDARRAHDQMRSIVVDQAVRRDTAEVHGLRDLQAIERLLVARIASSGGELSLREAAEIAGSSDRSTRHWLQALLDTGLIWELHRWGRSSGKHQRAQPKVYAVDPGLVAACSLPVFGPGTGFAGRLIETAVAQALRVRAERRDARLSCYTRDRKGELDLVYEEGPFTAVVEVTAGDPARKVKAVTARAAELRADWAGVVALRSVGGTRPAGEGQVQIVAGHDFLDAVRDHTEALGWPT